MTIADKFLNTLNSKYGSINKKLIAQRMLKKTVNLGEAIVDILGATGIAGFKFHVPESEMVKYENEITDHYVDTNYAIQDHIAEKPITITLQGLVGDYFYSVNEIEDLLALVTPTISLVKQLIPQVTNVVQGIKAWKNRNVVQYQFNQNGELISSSVNTVPLNYMDIFSLFQSLYKITSAQTRAFLFFEALWKARVPFSVETSWKRFDNMVVQSLQPRRDNNADITEFTITFKQITTTQTLTETVEQYTNRMEQLKSAEVNKGVEKGEAISIIDTGVVNV